MISLLDMELAEVYEQLSAAKLAGKRVLIVNDFDGTVSQNGPSGGKNPFDTILHPGCGQALLSLQKSGAVVGVISNRSGLQIARFYQAAGFETLPYIVGTHGMELYEPQVHDPLQGQTTVDPRFEKYRDLIAETLFNLRGRLLKYISFSENSDVNAIEVEIPSQFGPIFVENKAACKEYPAGLVNVYNLNKVDFRFRTELVKKMDQWFEQASCQVSDQSRMSQLRKIWGVNKYGNPGDEGSFTWSIEPLFLEGKAEGMDKLFAEVEKREGRSAPIGLIIYGGDSDRDAGAMNEARHIAKSTSHQMEAIGIWVKSSELASLAKQTSDIQLDNVDDYAGVLARMAEVLASG